MFSGFLFSFRDECGACSEAGRNVVEAQSSELRVGGTYLHFVLRANRIIISACGTSWHAGLIGEYLIEELAGINVEVEYASEFRYRTLVLDENDVILVISQSGETADTLEAVRIGRANGCTVCGICNKVGSAISRETDAGVYLHAGPEIGVASTKAFTAQVTVLTLIALAVGRKRGVLLDEKFFPILEDLRRMPELLQRVIDNNIKVVEDVSKVYRFVVFAANASQR
mmetsp:Transcript_48653/g.126246  ORF Transcript_48653/g.126246 Transcript_48653/m.126246 type:complete len:227 (+) Transcript_48653:1069-1749(+)